MTNFTTTTAKVAGMVSAVPRRIEHNSAYAEIFGDMEVAKITKMTGIVERRVVPDGMATSDLCVAAADDLLAHLEWDKDSVDLLVFVSQTCDYMLPATACSIHGRMGLSQNCAAFDVNLGCTGYVYGLSIVAGLLQGGLGKRALLLVGDTISRVVSPKDRSTVLLFGDAGSATAVEATENGPSMSFILGSDGRGQESLIVPAGGFRNPRTAETCVRIEGEDGSARSAEDLYMNGGDLLAFTLSAVPTLIKASLSYTGLDTEQIDQFVFHQANKFMIEHFARKSGIPMDRVPLNLDRYGNTSSASVPLAICSELKGILASKQQKLLAAAFGVGYSVAAVVFDLGPHAYVGLVEVS